MWVTNNLGYDVELSGVHLYRASQQEITEAQATALLANATYVLLKTNGQLVQSDSQPDANGQYYVRPLDGAITLNGFPSNPNGSPEVSPLEAFDIGKEEGGSADLEDNKEATIDVSTYTEPVVLTPTSGKDGMKKATVTLDNIPSGADLETNHAATINVATYTDPVEITPIQGKDGMEKVTVSLSNIPAGANMLYEWAVNGSSYVYLSVSTSPSTLEDLKSLPQLKGMTGGGLNFQSTYFADATNYVRTSDNEFTVTVGGSSKTFTRGNNDIEIWNVPPEVETTKQATIDVSTYDPSNKPVITPTAGKQSMAEVEVTLSNIPSGGSATAYTWYSEDYDWKWSDFNVAPTSIADFLNKFVLSTSGGYMTIDHWSNFGEPSNYTRISDTSFSFSPDGENTVTFTRDSTKDFTLWQLSE